MTPKPKKQNEDIRKFLKKKGIPSLAKALNKVMLKKHKQRFEHYFSTIRLENDEQVNSILANIQLNGWELVSTNESSYQGKIFINLFFKRPV